MPETTEQRSDHLEAPNSKLLPATPTRCSLEQKDNASIPMSMLHVFDLPQPYTKPSAKSLLDALALLAIAPPSWDVKPTEDDTIVQKRNHQVRKIQVNPEGVTDYLTRIVGSALQWIEDEGAREEIWSQASARLSERSGRTAMGALSRNFTIPSATGFFQLSIHEPTLTGDDLGLKTWAASYLLAKRLRDLDVMKSAISSRARVLELGSGTGLVGLAAAGLGAEVVLTDLPSIHTNLARNVHGNIEIVRSRDGSVCSGILDWSDPTSSRVFTASAIVSDSEGVSLQGRFPLILAADSLYSPEHPAMLVSAIEQWLSKDDDAAVVVEFPLRDAYLPEVADFRKRMNGIGLAILQEGEETGYDDWGDEGSGDDSGRALVKCWWSIWGRSVPAQ